MGDILIQITTTEYIQVRMYCYTISNYNPLSHFLY